MTRTILVRVLLFLVLLPRLRLSVLCAFKGVSIDSGLEIEDWIYSERFQRGREGGLGKRDKTRSTHAFCFYGNSCAMGGLMD